MHARARHLVKPVPEELPGLRSDAIVGRPLAEVILQEVQAGLLEKCCGLRRHCGAG